MIRIINGITDIDCGGDCFIAKLCPTLDTLWTVCSLPESSVHGIFQQRILERITIPFSRGSSQPRDWTQVSHIAGGFFTDQATREDIFFWLVPRGLQDLSSLIRDQTQGPRNESSSPNHWTTREFPNIDYSPQNLWEKIQGGKLIFKVFSHQCPYSSLVLPPLLSTWV